MVVLKADKELTPSQNIQIMFHILRVWPPGSSRNFSQVPEPGNMRKYEGNMKKYEGIMKKYKGNMNKYEGKMKEYNREEGKGSQSEEKVIWAPIQKYLSSD